jgi:predicted DNA-binding transcriptional regulator AlpA
MNRAGDSVSEVLLLNEKEVAGKTGLSVSRLWRMRATRTGIPFVKLSPERTGRIRYRLEDVTAYISQNPKPAKKPKPKAPTASEARTIEPVTMTCTEAAQRHQGQTPLNIAKMCLRGKAMANRYGGPSRVPTKQAAAVLFGRKVGRCWHIPVSELDRVFLGKQE